MKTLFHKTAQACLFLLLLVVACKSVDNNKNNTPPCEGDDCDTTQNPCTDCDTTPQANLNIDTTLQAGFERVRFAVSSDIIRNPERGFFNHLEWNNANGSPMSSGTLQTLKDQYLSLVANIYYMMNYADKPLDAPMLALVADNLQAARDNGFKVILRFAYSKSESAAVYDAPLEIVTGHIRQLKSILQEYVDVIAVMEAGFVGVWGEWYYTNHYGGGTMPNITMRNQLVDSILAALPAERMICLRTPGYKLKMLGITYADTLTRSEAYSGTKKARLAYHNDCFVASSNDMGTFFSLVERVYNRADSRYTAMGGETCAPSDYSECVNSLVQMRDYHWSYLNKDYHQKVLGSWASQGCMDDVKKRLGYRFELHYADRPTTVQKGADYNIKCFIKNSGFAAPYNPRDVYLLLLTNDGSEVQRIKLNNVDPRFWMAGEYRLVDMALPIPENMAAGEYKLALYLPDPKPTIAAVPDYAIRFANNNLWNDAKGYNTLFTVTVP
ncbi:hypothetical protein FACS1894156_0510 [Bacteroidia bacterium]|nr:hypothetical protein FACS1894156_0510 [Bacteroidia bacterium]